MKKLLLAIILFLAIAGMSGASTYYLDFSGSGEPPTNWSTMYATSPASFTDAGTYGSISTGYLTSGYTYGYWEISASGISTGDYTYSVTLGGNIGTDLKAVFGVRTGSYAGYWFAHATGSAHFVVADFGSTWSTVTTDDACSLGNNDLIMLKVQGTGASTTIEIYKNAVLVYAATSPDTASDSGPPGIGERGGALYATQFWTVRSVQVDDIVEATPTNTPTVTVTPTPHAAIAWKDGLMGVAGNTVTGWRDESTDPGFNAYFEYAQNGTSADLIRNTVDAYGKTLSPSQSLDLSVYPYLELKVDTLTSSTLWGIGIQELEGSYDHWTLATSQSSTGVFYYNIENATGWTSGTHAFSVELLSIGSGNKKVTYDYIQIMDAEPSPTSTPTSTFTYTDTPTLTATPTVTTTPTLAPTATQTPGVLWETIFIGIEGNTVSTWAQTNCAMLYTSNSKTAMSRISAGDCLVTSPITTMNSTLRFQMKIDSVVSGDAYQFVLQMEEAPYTSILLTRYNIDPGLWDVSLYNKIVSGGANFSDWNGKSFSIKVWFNSGLTSGYARVCNYKYVLPAECNPLMPYATPIEIGWHMTMWGNDTVNHRWSGYNNNYHNPDVTVTPSINVTPGTGKRDIAMTYYPVSNFYSPQSLRYDLDATYDQRSVVDVKRVLQCMQMSGLGGIALDIENYYQITSTATAQIIGTPSFSQEVVRAYIQNIKSFNDEGTKHYVAIPAYEDKSNWLKGAYSCRTCTVQAAYDDLNSWMDLFYMNASFPNVGYKIQNRPVLFMYSYEDSYGTRGYGRLSAAELKVWKDAYTLAHGISPIIISNMRRTSHPAELELGVLYTDVIDGIYEWPVIFDSGPYKTPTPVGMDFYHELPVEKLYWESQDANSLYMLSEKQISVVCSTAWIGFDDEPINGWGVGHRGIAYRDGNEWTLDYHTQRALDNNYPIKIFPWDDSSEGTNLEPSVEFSQLFSDAPGQPGILWTLYRVHKWINDFHGVSNDGLTDVNFWVPYMAFSILKNFPGSAAAIQLYGSVSDSISKGRYVTASSQVSTYVNLTFGDWDTLWVKSGSVNYRGTGSVNKRKAKEYYHIH